MSAATGGHLGSKYPEHVKQPGDEARTRLKYYEVKKSYELTPPKK
jgi:hypothetical protein